MSKSRVTLETGELDKLRKQLRKDGPMHLQVGVLANRTLRQNDEGGGESNADVGLKMEFGSIEDAVPARSFLRMPLIQELPVALKQIDPQRWGRNLIQHGLRVTLEQLGVLAVSVVDDAFASGGFGSWKKLSWKTVWLKRKRKLPNPTGILLATYQLRSSIDFAVKKGKL